MELKVMTEEATPRSSMMEVPSELQVVTAPHAEEVEVEVEEMEEGALEMVGLRVGAGGVEEEEAVSRASELPTEVEVRAAEALREAAEEVADLRAGGVAGVDL